VKRKLNKELRCSLFQLIAMNLVRADLDKYNEKVRDFAQYLYEKKYKKFKKKMAALPSNFFTTSSIVTLQNGSLTKFNTNSISGYYMPEYVSERTRGWYGAESAIRLKNSVAVNQDDSYQIEADAKNLNVMDAKKYKALKKEGVNLASKTESLLDELKGVLMGCSTVAGLRKMLPEFELFYPSDEQDVMPVCIPQADNLKIAAESWAETNSAL